MQLRNGQNTISDVRFEAARHRMYERHGDEYETVHNGSGRSEELPSQLSARHRREERALENARNTLSVAQWIKRYPDPPQLVQIREENKAFFREFDLQYEAVRDDLRDQGINPNHVPSDDITREARYRMGLEEDKEPPLYKPKSAAESLDEHSDYNHDFQKTEPYPLWRGYAARSGGQGARHCGRLSGNDAPEIVTAKQIERSADSFWDRTIARGKALEGTRSREQEPQQRQQEK